MYPFNLRSAAAAQYKKSIDAVNRELNMLFSAYIEGLFPLHNKWCNSKMIHEKGYEVGALMDF